MDALTWSMGSVKCQNPWRDYETNGLQEHENMKLNCLREPLDQE